MLGLSAAGLSPVDVRPKCLYSRVRYSFAKQAQTGNVRLENKSLCYFDKTIMEEKPEIGIAEKCVVESRRRFFVYYVMRIMRMTSRYCTPSQYHCAVHDVTSDGIPWRHEWWHSMTPRVGNASRQLMRSSWCDVVWRHWRRRITSSYDVMDVAVWRQWRYRMTSLTSPCELYAFWSTALREAKKVIAA